ncbi:Nuclear export mediator factor NEMF [Vitis vinifera]|uniref:Nuclear export mediator factor NEMF n=1 Tax=Vitis vinifera TaxID=29760 RepID=A0A438F6S6_VITVI|nr:Nuclear export mediator factor NEMF [Vitis vinifera]
MISAFISLLYIHADPHGASSTVIKNHKPEHPVPPLTLNQAGCFTVCHSQVWDSKIVTSAWWVYPHQSSLGSHLYERRVRGEEEGAQDFEENESLKGNSDSESEKEETDEKRTAESKSITDPPTHQPILEGFSEISSAHNELTTSNVGSINLPEVPLEERNMLNGNDSEHIDDISGRHVSSVNPQLEDLIDWALELGSNTASGKKYALETSQVDLEDHNHEYRKAKVREKPYISKAERRKLKKGQKTSTSDAGGDHGKEEMGL